MFAFRRRQKAARAAIRPFDSPNPRLATLTVPVPAVVTIREPRFSPEVSETTGAEATTPAPVVA